MQGTDTVILGDDYGEARASSERLVAELSRCMADGKLELPSLPEVALKIRSALADDAVSIAEIARLIGADPALAVRILKTANSALFYRGTKPITSLHDAVARLGHKMVRNIALSFAAQQVFIGYGSQEVRSYLAGIWRHSIHVAELAHMLARVRTQSNPDDAFLAGLLHEIGKLYILMRAKDNAEILAAEGAFQSVMDVWHPRIGRAVLETWELPSELAAAVGDHETCPLEAADPPSLTQIIAVANYLAEHSAEGCRDEQFYAKAPSFGSLAMDRPTFDWLLRAGDVDIRMLILAFGV
ncbi:MAG TPA: HDOD domain-containing protein [Gammaproteobacteria bacterium]|nr:HDOD domain-containing protein [Gammaproteobacteria bacterium]